MKIYVVTTQLVVKGDDQGIETQAFSSQESALEFFEKYKQVDKPYCDKDGWLVETDTSSDYEAYADGDWL